MAEVRESPEAIPDHRPGADGRNLIDLSHTVEDGMITYKGLPAPVVCDFLSREASRDHYAPGRKSVV